MPRIVSLRLGFLWVAFALNDYEEATHIKIGFTDRHARDRTRQSLADNPY